MRRKEDIPLQKVTLNLYEGDFDFLRGLYSRIGAGKIIRKLVRKYRTEIEVKTAEGLPPTFEAAAKDIEL